MNRLLLLLACCLILSSGCKEDDPCEETLPSIDDYITSNNLDVEEGAEGLKYIIHTPGTTEKPSLSSSVEVKYEGRLTDDRIFDGGERPFDLNLLIRGWQLGIPLIGSGGKITLYLPSELGYGNQGVGIICPGSDLIFDIELISFSN